ELRTPLNAVLGFARLLELDDLTRVQRENVDHIVRAGALLLDLVNDLLELARSSSGRLTLAIEPFDLVEVGEEAVDLVFPLARGHGVPVAGGGVAAAAVVGDRLRLKQAVLNLLTNAIKYNRPGGRVDVSVRVDGGLVVASVRDTGVGMTAEELARVF